MPTKIWIALPVQDESEYLPETINCILEQDYGDFHVVICVNQPDHWWNNPDKVSICHDNMLILSWLKTLDVSRFTVIDRCSPGNGWQGNHFGVGWARKTAMDHIAKVADANDLILSLDADTVFDHDYLLHIEKDFESNRQCSGMAIRYYHRLTTNEVRDRAVLRYEIYMRMYAINMLTSGNPYAFTAIGSAMACSVRAYNAVGGITPHKSGEDFYFIEKLRKYGQVLIWTEKEVYPAARFSERVFFGTGPAMIKGSGGDWKSYPFYLPEFFEDIRLSLDAFRVLKEKDIAFPMKSFLAESFKNENWWSKLASNFKSDEQFFRACIKKTDGLILLQYLRYRQGFVDLSDEECLIRNIEYHFPDEDKTILPILKDFSFSNSDIRIIDNLRNRLKEKEDILKKQIEVLKF